jgi:hypothetical protein
LVGAKSEGKLLLIEIPEMQEKTKSKPEMQEKMKIKTRNGRPEMKEKDENQNQKCKTGIN